MFLATRGGGKRRRKTKIVGVRTEIEDAGFYPLRWRRPGREGGREGSKQGGDGGY